MGERASGAMLWWSRLWAPVRRGILTAAPLWPYYALMYALGVFHLVEVHVLDPAATELVRQVTGSTVHLFARFEAPLYEAIGALWTPARVAGATAYYLFGYVALLAWTPHLVASTGDRPRLKRVLLTYPFVYLVALPGYLFLPQLNPYVALGLAEPFSALFGGLEGSYYLFTTVDNTVPSLHVAYTVALTWHLAQSEDALLGGAAVAHGVVLVASVVYLRVHWLGDVVAGVLVAALGVKLADRAARREGALAGLVRWLDREGRVGMGMFLGWLRRRG